MAPIQTYTSLKRPRNTCFVCGGPQDGLFQKLQYWYCRCRVCGLTSHFPLPDASTIDRHYEEKFASGNYQVLYSFASQYRRIYEDYTRILGRLIDLNNGPSILDVGCFTGEFLCILRNAGADVYGLELQEKAAAIASERLPGRVFRAKVEGTDFPQLYYDAITVLAVIEHVTNPRDLLERCVSLLKPGAAMMIQTPNVDSALCRIAGRFWPPYAPIEHLHLFSSRSLRLLLRDVGLQDIQVKTHWKTLPIEYVYQMMQNFGPELRRLITPIYNIIPSALRQACFPFYVGEMLVTARKPMLGD